MAASAATATAPEEKAKAPEVKTKANTPYPKWHKIGDGEDVGLRINNSLTGTTIPFAPAQGRRLTMYVCGPTVYNSAHLGHARNYLTFDIIRRILEDYLNYDVQLVMNVTDIDDKIIKQMREEGKELEEVARFWEQDFINDMHALNIRMPHVLTRVSEYVAENIAYVEQILAHGYAYVSEGSVYFDTAAYKAKHDYGKLEPWSVGNSVLLAEGEGALTQHSAKRDPNDFVLWKNAKEGEPHWTSPWGEGRPGWHIECSAMASDVLGANIDIHAGGEDLKFPHHDNELAQAEAYWENNQWINYFLHSGHLNIDGLKMAKSLKNFIKIKDSLKRFSPRQLRLTFLLHKWDAPMSYDIDTMNQSIDIEKMYVEFFANVKAAVRVQAGSLTIKQRWDADEKDLAAVFATKREAVHASLLDNFNTAGAMTALQELVRAANRYLDSKGGSSGPNVRALLLQSIAQYVTKMFRVFGLIPDNDVGFAAAGAAATDLETAVYPYLEAFASFRDSVRAAARDASTDVKTAVLQLSDHVRDDVLPMLGVRLEDKGAAASVIKLDDRDRLMQEREQKRLKQEEAAARKAAERAAAEKKEAERAARAQIDPKTMFLGQTDKYSKFDESGVPTHAADGTELTKSAAKKLKKEYDRQAADHAKYLAKQQQAKEE